MNIQDKSWLKGYFEGLKDGRNQRIKAIKKVIKMLVELKNMENNL